MVKIWPRNNSHELSAVCEVPEPVERLGVVLRARLDELDETELRLLGLGRKRLEPRVERSEAGEGHDLVVAVVDVDELGLLLHARHPLRSSSVPLAVL